MDFKPEYDPSVNGPAAAPPAKRSWFWWRNKNSAEDAAALEKLKLEKEIADIDKQVDKGLKMLIKPHVQRQSILSVTNSVCWAGF